MSRYLSVLCIIKNEEYLEEFIIYHYLQGVQHFYIYDNESTIPIHKRLNHYFYHKLCTVIHFPGKVKQVEAYNHCIFNFGKDTEWLAIIDGDEYILPRHDENLIKFLKKYDNYSAIAINWINFGSNYHQFKKPGLLTENYTFCQVKSDGHLKTICRPRDVRKITSPHFVVLKDQNSGYVDCKKVELKLSNNFAFNYNNTTDIIQINHYWGKSYQEMEQKIDRGRATMNSKRIMPPNYHELYNETEDRLMKNKFSSKIKNVMNAINTHPKMYKLLNPDLEKIFGDNLDKYTVHLIDNGIKEKRPITIYDINPKFNFKIYKKNYSDLSNLTCMQLIEHFMYYGKKEGRVFDKLL